MVATVTLSHHGHHTENVKTLLHAHIEHEKMSYMIVLLGILLLWEAMPSTSIINSLQRVTILYQGHVIKIWFP